MRLWSEARSWLKDTDFSSTAWCSRTGMVTSPNDSEPFQIVRTRATFLRGGSQASPRRGAARPQRSADAEGAQAGGDGDADQHHDQERGAEPDRDRRGGQGGDAGVDDDAAVAPI